MSARYAIEFAKGALGIAAIFAVGIVLTVLFYAIGKHFGWAACFGSVIALFCIAGGLARVWDTR